MSEGPYFVTGHGGICGPAGVIGVAMDRDAALRIVGEFNRLHAIIAKLPKDADGNPVCPGDQVWEVTLDNHVEMRLVDHLSSHIPASIPVGHSLYFGNTYRTEERARAIAKLRQQKGREASDE
jgi:hypothetical protein